MKDWIYRVFILITLTVLIMSCSSLTINEFKDKYEWDIVIATVDGSCYGNGTCCTYSYNGKSYYEPIPSFPKKNIGTQFKLLISKDDPEDTYIYLLDQQVIKGDFYEQTRLDIKKVKKLNINYGYIEVEYESLRYPLFSYELKQKKVRNQLIFNMKYFRKFKKIMDENGQVVVDIYLEKTDTNGLFTEHTILNVEESLK